MSEIKRALSELGGAIARLERAAAHVETSRLEAVPVGVQRDMFAAKPQKASKKGNGGFPVDSALIAQRLDKAIKKVEELLEG